MPIWTLFGIKEGVSTTKWPWGAGDDGQIGVLGMPRFDPKGCPDGCQACADACLPGAITRTDRSPHTGISLDYGRCVVCQMCTEVCPVGAFAKSEDWAFGVRTRDDLVWDDAVRSTTGTELQAQIRQVFGRSLHIRHVDSGSCNGCESELQALNNPFTTCIALEYSSRRRRASPICCW